MSRVVRTKITCITETSKVDTQRYTVSCGGSCSGRLALWLVHPPLMQKCKGLRPATSSLYIRIYGMSCLVGIQCYSLIPSKRSKYKNIAAISGVLASRASGCAFMV